MEKLEYPNLNVATYISKEQVDLVMDYHKWDEDKIKTGAKIREVLSEALAEIIRLVPPCADRSAAIRKLRDCRMDCNSALTHDGKL